MALVCGNMFRFLLCCLLPLMPHPVAEELRDRSSFGLHDPFHRPVIDTHPLATPYYLEEVVAVAVQTPRRTLAPGSIDLVTGTTPPTHLIFNHFLFRPRNKALARASLRETLNHPRAGAEPPVSYAPVHAGRRGESGTAYRTHLHATGPFACISLYARIGILIHPALAQGVRQWALNWVKTS